MNTPFKETATIEPALQAVVKAGQLLMENGAEIHRIESTLSHMAAALKIQSFEAFVMNRGIFVSGLNSQGQSEAKMITTQAITTNLRILEEVNQLSRLISSQDGWSPSQILLQLQEIEGKEDYQWNILLLAYFFGAGGFSLALGSSLLESLLAGLAGFIIGLSIRLLGNTIKTNFILTILASGIASLLVNLLIFSNLEANRGLILLAAFMVLIPGAAFVNAIREFSQNNYPTGLSLLMSALMTCISISVGVASAIELLPFAGQMTGSFTLPQTSLLDILLRSLAAGIGTVAFSVLYQTPNRFFLDLLKLGTLTWFLYLLIMKLSGLEALAILVSGLTTASLSRYLAILRKTPATMFLVTSMFPLIPGISFYQATYHLITGSTDMAFQLMRTSFITAFTITIALSLVQHLPLNWVRKK